MRTLTLVLLAMAFAFGGCRRESATSDPASPTAQKPIRIATFAPKAIDPGKLAEGIGRKISENLFEGLTTRAADGKPVPGLAESWTTSPDGLAWTFTLRSGLVWSDGTPLTAADVVWSLQRAVDPKTGNPNASMLDVLANAQAILAGTASPDTLGVRADAPGKVTLQLDRPDVDLPRRLSTGYLAPVPRQAIEKHGESWTRPGKIVVSGPFQLLEEEHESRMVLGKNPRYHSAPKVAVERIEYRFTSDSSTAWQWYELGEVDIVDALLPQEVGEKLREEGSKALRLSAFDGVFFAFANTRTGPLADVRVRQALDLAIDRAQLTRLILRGGEKPAWGVLPPRMAPAVAARGRDLTKAKALLAEAGFTADKPLALTLWFNTTQKLTRVAEFMARDLKEGLGATVTLHNLEWGAYLGELDAGRTELALLNMGGYDALDFLGMLESTASPSRTGWKNADYDAAVKDLRNARTDAERDGAIARAEAVVAQHRPLIPLFQPVRQNVVRPGLGGFEDTPDDIHPFRWMHWE